MLVSIRGVTNLTSNISTILSEVKRVAAWETSKAGRVSSVSLTILSYPKSKFAVVAL